MTEQEIKAAVRARDGHCCTQCGMTRAQHFARYERDLEVHRLDPGSPYTLEGCILVCRACHGPLPKLRRGWNYDKTMSVCLDVDLYHMAGLIAFHAGADLDAYVNELLRPLIERDWPRALRTLDPKGKAKPSDN